jgi:hypothetical protein
MMLTPCYIQVGPVSCSSFSAAASSSMAAAANAASISYLAPQAQRSSPNGQNTHVVDAVMDYLDTLSSGCAVAKDTASLHVLELEAAVEGLDLEEGVDVEG